MRQSEIFTNLKIIFILFVLFQFTSETFAQHNTSIYDRDTIITSAKKLMESAQLCALITLDDKDYPSARIMDPFVPDDDMIVWLGTNLNSRKINEIKNNSNVSLYYQSPSAAGYVVIKGNAYIVDDTAAKETYWKSDWSRFYEIDKSNFVLIKVIPNKVELIDYSKGIIGDSATWESPFAEFNVIKSN